MDDSSESPYRIVKKVSKLRIIYLSISEDQMSSNYFLAEEKECSP